MSYYEEMGSMSLIARITSISEDGQKLYLKFENGNTATVDHPPEDLEFDVGSVLLVRPEDNYLELAPKELWPEKSWVGVVRIKLNDVTIIDSRGNWIKVPNNNEITYEEGNTVEVKDSIGVIRVLSKKPLKYIDPPEIDESIIEKFKTAKGGDKVTFNDFGGLSDVVERARELIEIPLKRKNYINKIGARTIKGVLFTGPPGSGKTMLARIIANSTDSVFYEISGPEVFSKWYGQSEKIIRLLFKEAAKKEKAIIFFDEIDSVASKRAEESHEASRRVVAQLLTVMDGFNSDDNVIVIATTNRPQDIDAALRRPGRFDWEIKFPLPDKFDREQILKSSARKLSIIGDLSHEWVAQNTKSWSAAELTAIWSEAALLAVEDNRQNIINEDFIGGYERVSAQREEEGYFSLGGNID
jgi:transitional endoplasmic reticulum ATPase